MQCFTLVVKMLLHVILVHKYRVSIYKNISLIIFVSTQHARFYFQLRPLSFLKLFTGAQ